MSESITKYDLSMKVGQYLDSHSVLPLLEFLSTQRLYNEKYLLAAKLDILDKTHMLDYSADIYKMYHGVTTTPQVYIDRRTQILENLKGLRTNAEPIIELVNQVQEKSTTSMRDSKSVLNYLEKETNFKMEMLDDLIKYAKGLYESGNYAIASSYLYFCTLVMSPNDKNFLSVLWGKLAASTLLQDWEAALEDSNKLKDYIDGTNNTSPVFILQQRTWLIHWSLFIFFNHSKGWDLIIDMFLYRPHYLNAIQTTCPHILRYLTAAVIVNRQRRTALKDLIKVIQQESYSYRDPITEFIEQLYIKFDFEAARQKLQECQTVVNTDFFLVNLLGEFVESARLLIFENFCRIHQCITISMLAEKLNMTSDSAECWIVNLIRTARLNAKIDSKLGHVIMMGQQDLASPYQQLIEKIENLNAKSEILENLIQTRVKAKITDSSNIVWN